ncbi:MAG: metallophosphoesterase [Cyanobacteria bacterium]|nr:metallophosphoesterase [Cyanobacteriota bacterium]
MPFKPFRVVIISDILYGTDKPRDGQLKSLPSRALSLLRYLINRISNEIRPAFVIQLGNSIENEDAEEDEENYSTIVDAFKQLTVPFYHVLGDNEQANLSSEQLGSLLRYPKFYYSFDSGECHFVVLFASAKAHTDIHIDPEQQKWLAEDLLATAKPTIVFSHHPLDEQEMYGNYLFEEKPELCFVEERAEIREILARSGKVKCVFSGHAHWNNLQEHDGIPYVTLQSLVENVAKTGKTASESFTVLTLSEREIDVDVQGLDPAGYRFSIK